MRRSLAIVIAASTVAAVSGGAVSACRETSSDTSRGTNEAVGQIGGREIVVESASFCPSGFGSPDDVTLILSSREGDCDAHKNQLVKPDATTLTLHLVQVTGPGTFRVKRGDRGAGEALARFRAVDQGCDESMSRDANDGSVTLTGVDTSSKGFIKGSFDVTFDGEHLRGDFDTSVCTVDHLCGQPSQCGE